MPDWKSKSPQQGQGVTTPRKQQGLQAALNISIDISKGRNVREYPYWYFDLNSGCGFNHEVNCDGSPLVFLAEAMASRRAFRAHFCDRDAQAVATLREKIAGLVLPQGCVVTATCMDNATFCEHAGFLIRQAEQNWRYAIGAVYCDPNGPKGMPAEALAKFAAAFPRIDVMLNVNLSFFRRIRAHLPKAKRLRHFEHYPTLPELLDLLGRRHWMVRNPDRYANGGCEDFALFVGRNFETGSRKFMDFYPIGHEAGRHILTTYTKWHDPEQTDLFVAPKTKKDDAAEGKQSA